MTAFPSPAPLSSCLTTTAVTPGRSDRIRVDRLDHVVDRADALDADGDGDARPPEQAPSRGLERLGPQRRRRAVDRDTEGDGHGHLVVGDVPRLDDGHAARHPIAELVEEVRAVEELRGEGAGPEVVDDDEVQPRPHPVGDGGRDDVVRRPSSTSAEAARAHEHEVAVDRG